MFEFEGEQFTEQEVLDAATSLNLSFDDYINKYNVTPVGKEQTATADAASVAVETPVDGDSQQVTGSSESPRRSVRARVRKSDVQRRENIFNEKVSNAEKGFYEATAVDVDDLYDTTKKELETEFAIANKPVTKGTYMGSTYTYTPADEYTGAKKDMYDIYTSSGQVDLSDDYFTETLYKKKRALATTYIDDLPTDIKEEVEKNVEKDFGQVQEKVQSIETAIDNAVSIRSKFEAGEELTEDEIKEYKAFVASVPKLQEEYADAAAASKDASFALDYFKRSYKITDQIAAAFKTTGLEIASGVLEVGNMMAAEKDYQSSASKYVNDVLIAHQKDIEENLEAPVSLDDLEASGDKWSGADTWAAQLFANQTPFLLAASTGNAAPYLFGAMGTTSRLSQFSVEEQTARENIDRLEKELLEATDSFDIAAIKSDIKKNKNITKKNDGLKLLTSVGHGAAEMIDGYADKLLLGGIKKSWKRIGPDEFKASWKQAGKQYTAGVLTETGSESVTQVGQNAFDIWFDNADKSYFEGLDEAAAGGFVMGNGFKVTEFGGIARNIVANVAADKNQRAEVAALTEKLNGFRNIINDPNASEAAKQEATTQRQKTEKELIRLNDVTLARFEKLSFEDQQQVMEFDRQARAVNRRWTRIAADNSLTDAEKDAMRIELEQEFNQAQEQKRAILQTTSPANLVSADKAKAGLFEEGDLVRELEDGNVSLQKVKAHNKKSGYAKAVVEVSDQALEDITNFVDEGNTEATIEVDGTRINFDQAVAIVTQNEGRNGLYDPKSGVIAYMPQRGRSKGKSLAAVPLHEYMHAAFVGLGIPKSEFAAIREDLLNTIEDIDLPENKKNAIKQSIALYDQRISKRVDEGDITAQQAEEIGGEEIFNIIGDVIAQDVLRGNKKQDFLQRLSIRIKNLLNGKLDAEVIDGLNIDTAQGALEFVTRFQEDVAVGKTITKQTLSGTTTDEEAEALGSEIAQEVKFEDDSINEQFKAFTYDGKVNNAPESFHAIAAYQYEPLAQAVVNTLANKGIASGSAEQNNLIMGYLEDATNRQELVEQLVIPVGGNQASSLLGLAKTYNPEIGSFGGYAKGFLAARAIRQLEQKMRGSFIGSQKIDSPESKEIMADDAIADDIRTIAEKLNLPQEILDKAYKLAELAAIKADKALEGKDISDLKKVNLRNKAFNEIFAKQLFKDIAVQLGKNTKKSSDFTNYINNNFEALRDIALTNIDFQKGGGPSADWNTIEPTQAEFLEYYEAKNEKTSTRSDRKKSLNNAIARAIANEARIEFAKRDPRTADLFKEKHGVVLASEIEAPANGPTKFSDMAGFKDGAGRPAQNVPAALLDKFGGEYNLSTETGQNELVNDLKKIGPSLPIEIIGSFSKIFPNHRMMKDAYKNSKNSKEGAAEFARLKAQLKEKIETVVEEIKQQSTTKLEGAAQGWAARDFGNWLGNTPQDIKKSIESGRMRDFNESNAAMHEQVWKPLYEAIIKDKSAARLAIYLTPTSFGGAGWHRLGAEVIGYSQDPKGNGKKLYEWEHAMQANNARLFLVASALNNVPFDTAYPAVINNYKVIALDAAADAVLKKANRGNSMGIGWDVYSGHWTQRYYSPDVAIFDGGLNPADVTDVNGVTFDKKYNIDNNGHSTGGVLGSEVIFEPNTPGDFNEASTAYKAIFMVGSPGGGKTNVGKGLRLGRKGYKVVNQDIALEALKKAAGLPENESNYTKEQKSLRSKLGSQAVKAGKDKFQQYKNEGKGFLVDGTGASYNATTKKINELKEAGYDVYLVAAMTPKKVAIERNKARKERSLPTFVVSKSYDQVVESLAKYKQDYGDKLFEIDTTTIGFGEALPQEFLDKVYNGITQTKVAKSTLDKVAESKALGSEILSNEFNEILERVKGVKAEARYSEARANKLAQNKGRFKFFVPYSAEDFMGLIYPTLGKGKEGDANLEWYKKNIIKPFAKGISNFESAKQESMDNWRTLKKSLKGTPAALGKQAVRGFSNEDAIRVYLWNERDVVPESLSKKDTEALVAYVNAKPDLKAFAEQVVDITEGVDYPAPQKDWMIGTLTTDLVNFVNTAKRADFLEEWQANVDAVYSKDNMNKLKAIYGQDYVDALENILYRMKTGRNRPSGQSKIENQFQNWINDSVGTVMFFNTRSAVLQTISAVNFLNWSDNNPIKAGVAFANQPQFWNDFAYLFNSDFLKQRRSGLKNDVNADEIAREAAGAANKYKAALNALLKAGFSPTQIADSFAIAIGGASFYRNRVNTYLKQGMDQKQAEEAAMLDFKETAEESQQSSRPDKVSQEQASSLGRIILAFANTPAQYTRLTKRAAQDLINGRGDWKTNVSKLLYYGAVQNIIFTAIRQALFAMSFDDEEEKEETYTSIANGIADTLLRGSGVYGAAAATLKNIVMEAIKQAKSDRPDYTKAALKITTLSPPVDTKIRRLMSAGRAFTYKQSLEDMREMGWDVDNPAALAVGQVASALGNVPLDRLILKLQNLKNASNSEYETYQRIFMALGWQDWELGIEDDDSKGSLKKGRGRKSGSLKKGRQRRKGRTPAKRLERGVAGKAHRDGTIEVDPNLSPVEREKTIAHEKQHVKDIKAGKLDYDDNYVYWNDKKYPRKNGKIKYKGNWVEEGHPSLPWEKKAYNAEPSTKEIKEKKKRTKLY